MVQDRRNLERMYEQRERDRQRNEMRQAEARAREAEMRAEDRRQRRSSGGTGGDRNRSTHDRAVHDSDAVVYERGASSQSGILGALVLGLLLAAVGAAAWWSFKLLRWGFGHLLRLVGWGGVATLAAVALAGGYAWVRFFS